MLKNKRPICTFSFDRPSSPRPRLRPPPWRPFWSLPRRPPPSPAGLLVSEGLRGPRVRTWPRVARNPPPQLLLVLIMCFLVRVSLVFRRTQCFAENVWVKAANVSKSSHLRHLNLLFLLGVLLVATEGGLFYLNANVSQFGLLPKTRCRWRNQRLRLCCCRKVLRHPAAAFECERGGGYDSRGLPARGSCG